MFYKLTAVITAIFMVVGCSDSKPKETKSESVKVVKTLNLNGSSNFSKSYEYPAIINSLQDSTMAFEVSGRITKFYYKEGDFIKKGSTIAKLDDTIYKANYASSLSNLKQSQLDYKRYKVLFAEKAIAKRDLEEIKQRLDENKSNYQIAKKRLEDTKLIAEFDGIMGKKLVKDFARVTEKQAIIRLQDNSSYKVKFSVPESDILQASTKITPKSISKEMKFFVLIGKNNKPIAATFQDITTTAEEVTRTFEVTLVINQIENLNILPGMTANVQVMKKDKETQSLFIPLKAVFTDASKHSYVWIVKEGNRVEKTQITTGRLEKDSIEVVEGINNEATIVTSGVRFLKNDDQIKKYEKIGN